MKKTFYQILQIDSGAEIEIIEVAYKRLARKYHPDTNNSPNATAQMQEINEAYATLKDNFKRKQYDAEFLPNLGQSKTTKSESRNTKEHRNSGERVEKPQTNSKTTYYTSAKTEQEQNVKTDKARYVEWANKFYNRKKSQQKPKQQENLDSIRLIAISIIIFNILPFFYLVYAFNKQMTFINNSSDEGKWYNIYLICLSGVISIVSIYGGFRMYKLKNYRLAVFSTIALFFTSFLCCIISYFAAISGLVILFNPEVKMLFNINNKK